MTVEDLLVPASLAGVRVDRAVSTLTGLSRRDAAEVLAAGDVTIDGAVVTHQSRKLREGELLSVDLGSDAEQLEPLSSRDPGSDVAEIAFDVVYEDGEIIVVDKPPGLVVHHGHGHHQGTLLDGLLLRYPDLSEMVVVDDESGHIDPGRPGIVHRLDKGTSGLMVVGRTDGAVSSLVEQLRTRRAGRQYLALVAGTVEHDEGLVDAPVGRSGRVATRMAVSHNGKPARTRYKVLERLDLAPRSTLIEATLETGRTHQVRVHMAAIGHPVGGDDRYGEGSRTMPLMFLGGTEEPGEAERAEPGRLFLHAHKLTIDHPASGERVSWESPLPDDLAAVLRARQAAV